MNTGNKSKGAKTWDNCWAKADRVDIKIAKIILPKNTFLFLKYAFIVLQNEGSLASGILLN